MRVAIVRLTSLGDVVHTLPVAAAIKDQRPDAQVIWIAEEHEQVLVSGNPVVDQVIVAPLRRWKQLAQRGQMIEASRQVRRFARELRALHLDVVLDVQGWFHKTSPIVALSGAPMRIGFSRGYARQSLSTLATTIQVTPRATDTHIVDQNLRLLEPIGIQAPVARFVFPAWPSSKTRVAEWLRSRGTAAGSSIVLLPSTRGPQKLWPAAAFADLARRLRDATGRAVVLAGGPGDSRVLSAVQQGAPEVDMFAPDSIADLAVFLSTPALVIGNDTGPLHLASAADIPAIGLFGPTSGARNGPYGGRGVFVQSPTARMSDIPVDRVFDLAMNRLETRSADSILGRRLS